MPEIWLNYGITDVVLDIKAENLEQKIDSDGKILDDSEIIDFADHHSGTVATQPGRLNPYKIGIELFRDIEDRWNKGRFGKEFDCVGDISCDFNVGV